MLVTLQCDQQEIPLQVPAGTFVYESSFPPAEKPAGVTVRATLEQPHRCQPLKEALQHRRSGDVVVVVSDITRPIPYATFLPELLAVIESAGVRREEILILVATGMHRASTAEEHRAMFGEMVATGYRIEDHDAGAEDLVELSGKTWSGNGVRLNRRFMQAGFRILTGLVEPHFMAGFSGGRKAVCPGLADLATLHNFHGSRFLADPRASNASLAGNPCHLEAVSVASQAGIDFTLNVVLNRSRQVVRAFAGNLEAAHEAACQFVASHACPAVRQEADVAVTSSGGYPLDATFYQCVKGFVSCLPAVKTGGTIIALGGCREGIGSEPYTQTMRAYAGRWEQFLQDIAEAKRFTKDQWQFQMHCRTLAKIGEQNLHFITSGLPAETLGQLSVTGHAVSREKLAGQLQQQVEAALGAGKTLAVFPEGAYCVAVKE